MPLNSRCGYTTVFANPFVEQVLRLTSSEKSGIFASLDNLERFPLLGHPYEGELDTEVPVRELSIPHTHLDLYYWVDEPERRIVCLYIWDTRRDPANKFAGLYFD